MPGRAVNTSVLLHRLSAGDSRAAGQLLAKHRDKLRRSDLGFGPEESLSAYGDSGGPVFIDGVIAGITASRSRMSTT